MARRLFRVKSTVMALFTPSFLRDHSDEIVRAWEACVEAEARVVSLTGLILRDHIPELLQELAEWMETTNERDAGERMHAASVSHSAHRLEHGFELAQLVDEVRLLRKTLLSLLLSREAKEQHDGGDLGMPVRVTELARLNMGLDFAIAEAVEWFVNERERRLLALANREVELAREIKPDIVLCDIGLPDMDGYEVARQLRGDERLSDLRLVALTGYAQSEDRQRVTQAGFHAHLSKPAAIEELNEILA